MQFLETIKAYDGQLFHLDYHQQRLDHTLISSGAATSYMLQNLLDPPKSDLYRCRVLYDKVSTTVTYHPYQPKIFYSLQAVIDNTIAYDYKYADREQLDALFRQRRQSEDIVIVKNGLLSDTTIANIALYDGKEWVTPTKPLLFGTTRARLIDEGKVVQKDIPLNELHHYSKTAIMNAMLGFIEIKDGIILPK